MESATILLIGSKQAHKTFLATLQKRYCVVAVTSGSQGVAHAAEQSPRVVVLDAASLRTPGERICRALKESLAHTPIIHIHPGPRKGASSEANTLLFPPVTARRLQNSIGRLLHSEEDVIRCGPFMMNLPRRILIAHGQETQLTPKQSALIALFLRNPNQTLDRKTIMETVWKTAYVGDTRTLDVHVRWIRKLLEKDSAVPDYLRTVRGVGYQLVIPSPD